MNAATIRTNPLAFSLLVATALALSGPPATGAPFENVAVAVGLEGLGGGEAAWGDYNNDGWTDLYGGALWRNDKGVRFTKVDGPFGGAGVWGDYDNDGDLDLYLYESGKLLRNDGKDQFSDQSGILADRPIKVCRGAAWGDFNGDGFLDLYICGYEIWQPSAEWPDVIFQNKGGKSFTQAWQTTTTRRARGVTCADYDEDGDLDVYVSNYRLQPNSLWRNDGGFKFTNVAAEAGKVDGDGGLGAWGHTIGSAWGDFDSDGHLDLFVGNFSHPPAYQDRCMLYRNVHGETGSTFRQQPGEIIHWQESYATPALGDFDNDGFLDLYHTTVYGGDHGVLYRNASAELTPDGPAHDNPAETSPIGKWVLKNVTEETGTKTGASYQGSWADFDNDGDLDLLAAGGLFRNPGNDNHWLKLRLAGNGVNAFAIGAQARVHVGNWRITRQVEGGTGEGNQNDLTLHFGLGKRSEAVDIEIRWPDGSRQKAKSEVDRTAVITKESTR